MRLYASLWSGQQNTTIGGDNSTHEEIVKVRLQSTPEEISNFEKMLNRCLSSIKYITIKGEGYVQKNACTL